MYKYIKRVLDIIISIIVIIVFFVPMVILAIAIKIDSKGPVFFKQKRTGKYGKEFYLYKFRSMTSDNDILDFACENKLTKVGKFIRKTSLDELSQVINILKGDMSWIGPRPWIVEYYENFTEEQKRRVEVTSGLTGLAQCNGRNNISIFEKINYDIEYVDNISFALDVKIICMTIKSIFLGNGTEISKMGIKEELEALHNNYLNTYEVKIDNQEIEEETEIPVNAQVL